MIDIEKIKKDILATDKSRLKIEDLYNIVGENAPKKIEELKTIQYDFFYTCITMLVNDGVLSKCGTKTNNKAMELYLKYNVNFNKEIVKFNQEDLKFLAVLNKKINVDYYRKNIKAFYEDKEYIRVYNNFLNEIDEGKHNEIISINERSYHLFKDEKIIKGGKGVEPLAGRVLKRLKLEYEDIGCRDNYEPLLILTMPTFFSKESRNIIVVENLDTYWTLNRIAMDNVDFRDMTDMLIYGKGNAITGEFAQYDRYNISDKDRIFYFGDIDNHGFYIYAQFKEKFKNLNITLAVKLYELMIDLSDINNLKDVRTDNQSKLKDIELENVINNLTGDYRSKLRYILLNNKYIPQEVLNYENLSEYLQRSGVELLE